MAEQWEKIQRASFINLGETELNGEVVDEIQGTLIEKGSIHFDEGPAGRYKIELDSGETVDVLGSTILDEHMDAQNRDGSEKVPEGAYIKIVYLRDNPVKTRKREMKNFEVMVRK